MKVQCFHTWAKRWLNGGLIMNNNNPLEFLKREGRIYSFPEPENEQKDNSKFRLLVLGLLVCVFAAICHGQVQKGPRYHPLSDHDAGEALLQAE